MKRVGIVALRLASWQDAERRARQLARLYAVSSSVGEAISRIREPRELYDTACRIAVEHGLARLAWVGLYDEDLDRIVPVARRGEDDGYVDAITLTLKDADRNRGPAARALINNSYALSQDVATDPDFLWREAAVARGLRSCAVFPLRRQGRAVGVLALYVDQPGYFGDEEREVLGALADNISFAVDSAASETDRRRLLVDLGERVKELTLLHSAARLLQGPREFGAEVLEELVGAIPAAWQFPDMCTARIVWGDYSVRSPAWHDGPHALTGAIIASGRTGIVEVAYSGDAPFLDEERQLIQSLADMLSAHIDRIETGAALRRSEERLRAVIEHTPHVGIQWYDATGRLIFCNEASIATFGWQSNQVIGKTLDELNFTHEEARRFSTTIAKVAASGEPAGPMEFSYRRPDGSDGTLLSTVFRILDADGEPCYVCMDVDLTERRRLESQLQRAQRLEALGTLAGGVAHDFNNILTAIAGNANLALRDLPPNSPALESIAEIRTASERAADLVRQVLTFGRRDEPRRERVRLGEIVTEAAALLKATLPADVSMRCRLSDQAPPILADASQMHQVVMNLGTNAVHALDGRCGTVEIALDGADLADPAPDLPAGRYARLRVLDDGCGMDAATVERVFEPFFTTRPARRGTGLGLSVVHGIVTSHGGAIRIVSQPGTGTTFELLFPAAGTATTVTAPVVRPAADQPVAGQPRAHVLYVDDDEALVFLIRRVLERRGFRVTTCTAAEQALEAFRARPADFEAVVSDFTMHPLSGLELARAILAIRPDVPFILTSGYLLPEVTLEARQLGVREVILKPNTVQELGSALHRLIGA